MPRISHDDPDRVLACPDCDHAGDVFRREGNGNAHAGDPDATYRCQQCGSTFDEPVDRPARAWQPGRPGEPGQSGLAKIMADMTVEEFDAIVNGGESA